MSKLTLEITKNEALILELLIIGTLVNLETDYNKNKEDESFLKEEALSEITDLKALKSKIDKLTVI